MNEKEEVKVERSFRDFGLPEDIVKGLEERGIATPTDVQSAVLAHLLADPEELNPGDLLAQARTGSGKTLAYLLPLVKALREGEAARAWVVCPTRELAQQVAVEARLVLGAESVALLVGGVPYGPQHHELRMNPSLVAATPGRLGDHLRHGSLEAGCDVLVMDEADRMLDLGFREELDAIVAASATESRRWFFSATFPRNVAEAAGDWLRHPKLIRLDQGRGSSHVPQNYVVAPRARGFEALVRLVHFHEPHRALVFVNTRIEVEQVAQVLIREGISADGLSGDLSQEARERALQRLRDGRVAILVATDVAARGIDVPGLTHVYNLGLPTDPANFTHRVGRTARAGAEGEAWSVIAPEERRKLFYLSHETDAKPEECEIPDRMTLVQRRRERLASRVAESLGEEGAELPEAFRVLVEEHGAEAVLSALVHRLEPDPPPEVPFRRLSSAASGAVLGAWLAVGLGREDGVHPKDLMNALGKLAQLTPDDFGQIKLLPRLTLVETTPECLLSLLKVRLTWGGRRVKLREAEPPRSR